jgi:hypothetical protein
MTTTTMMVMTMMTINHFHYLRAAFCQVSGFIIFTASLENTAVTSELYRQLHLKFL